MGTNTKAQARMSGKGTTRARAGDKGARTEDGRVGGAWARERHVQGARAQRGGEERVRRRGWEKREEREGARARGVRNRRGGGMVPETAKRLVVSSQHTRGKKLTEEQRR
ncbi:hypothetical protein DENSPDRAFT_840063 [Dentipellis sp. KUC8613]|nr:hypothetical protein DENSPDRAFT_840063 [Dentipellis sp. KUC8613]